MRLPELAHGNEHTSVTHLAPDIPEQLELAKRINNFLQGTYRAGIDPVQRTREIKDYRSTQPDGTAHISAAYSSEQDGRYSAEVHVAHRPSGSHSHYNLLTDGEHWLRNDITTGKQTTQTMMGSNAMLRDMLLYAPDGHETSTLLDRALSAHALMTALITDMNPGAHYKSGSDHYQTSIQHISESGDVIYRRIELIDGRIHNRIQRRLAVSAFINIGPGPVDVSQQLIYDININKRGSIQSDGIQLVQSSSDGLSPQALAHLAESSDVIPRRIDILHQALDDLSRDTFLNG